MKGMVFDNNKDITKSNVNKYRERTLEPGYSFFNSKVLLMAVSYVFTESGRTYSFHEIEGWLKEAGFCDLTRTDLKLPRSISVLTGRKYYV